MNSAIAAIVTGVLAFVVASIGLAIAKRRDVMSEAGRWLAVLLVFAMGLVFAVAVRYLKAGLTDDGVLLLLLATLAGIGVPWWRFTKQRV